MTQKNNLFLLKNIAELIDLTNVNPNATYQDIISLCRDAIKYGFKCIYVSSSQVKLANNFLKNKGIEIGAPVGFPFGNASTQAKLSEIISAHKDGAKWIDPVMNIIAFKSGDYNYVKQEFQEIVNTAHERGMGVKIIIETCYLNTKEKIKAAKLVEKSGADFLKTATGRGSRGVTLADVKLLHCVLNSKVKLKAAGKVRRLTDAVSYLRAGADRIGSSAGLKIVRQAIALEKKL